MPTTILCHVCGQPWCPWTDYPTADVEVEVLDVRMRQRTGTDAPMRPYEDDLRDLGGEGGTA